MISVGLLGGTFDPVHIGHIQLASAACKEIKLDQVIFIPSARPPHKVGRNVGNFEQRKQMLEIALEGSKNFSVSTVEEKRADLSYTVETLRELNAWREPQTRFFFIIGGDAFLEIETWQNGHEVLEIVDFVVAARAGFDQNAFAILLKKYGFEPGDDLNDRKWSNRVKGNTITLLKTEIDGVSSTEIRKRLRNRKRVEQLLPKGVFNYIIAHNMYRS